MGFPGSSNLSIFAAQHKGPFAKHGLSVELLFTPNSDVLRDGLAAAKSTSLKSAYFSTLRDVAQTPETIAWLTRYRRLAIRYERRADIHQALLDLACAHICLNFLRRPDGFC